MAYTPELSNYQSCTLRRIAWALGIPMTKAMNEMVEYISSVIDKRRVCAACKDKSKCNTCAFNKKGHFYAKDQQL